MAKTNPRGTFQLVADAVRVSVQTGDGLVREADVIREQQVSRTTARRALKVLESEGVLKPEPGVGWRVAGSPVPRSLPEQMIDLIRDDKLTVDDAFPSEAALCERLQKSRPTIRRALAVLEADGVLVSRPGKGRTVVRIPETVAELKAGAHETD